MNYYSRNSPQKRKKDLPAGFLITQKPSKSSKKPDRSRFTSRFNMSQNHSFYSAESQQHQNQLSYIKNYQRDEIYIQPFEQILIQEQQGRKDKNSKIQNGEDYKKSENTNLQSSELETHKKFQKQQKEKQEKKNLEVIKQTERKYFFRNNSFGDKQIQKEQQIVNVRKQPLIRKLINFDPNSHFESVSKNKKNNLQRQKYKGKSRQLIQNSLASNKNNQVLSNNQRQSLKQQQNEVVSSFIKKPIDLNNPNVIKQSDPNSHQKFKDNEENFSNIEVIGDSFYEQSDKFSQESAYFPLGSEQNFNSFTDVQQRSHSQYNYREQKVKTRTEQNKNKNEIFISEEQVKDVRQQNQVNNTKQQKIEDEQSFGFISSTALLQQTIRQLPQKLIPTYLKIYKELLRKQYEKQVTVRRMKQTQKMIRSLIVAHKICVKAEDYILNDFKDPSAQRIFINGEIILGLVRQLARII